MAKATPKLEQRKDTKTGLVRRTDVSILIDFSFDGQRIWIQTGEKIDENKWDEKNHRVKPNVIGSVEMNAIISSKCEQITKIYREAKLLGKNPSVSYLRHILQTGNSPLSKKSLIQHYKDFIEEHRIKSAIGTVKKLKTSMAHLEIFAKKHTLSLDFDAIDLTFLHKYVEYFQVTCKHIDGTIAKNIKIFKWFLNHCATRGFHSNFTFKSFTYKSKEPDIINLTVGELIHLHNLNIKNECLSQVRDVFCFSCYTALRYSDVKNLKKSDVNNGYIEIVSLKTQSKVVIPLIEESKSILAKYENVLGNRALPVLSNQKMNQYLKELGELAGLTRPITRVRYRGNERIETTTPLYKVLSSHMGRKTFISYMFSQNVESELIRAISNHKSIASFARYNNINDEHKASSMRTAFKNIA